TYLRTYEIEPAGELRENIGIVRPDRLESAITFDRIQDNARTDISAILFQTLRLNEDQNFTAEALPRIVQTNTFDMLGGNLTASNSLLALNRSNGLDTLRLSSAAEYKASRYTKNGHRFEVFGEIRADGYVYRNAAAGIQACNIEDSDALFEACRQALPRDLENDRFETYRFLPTIGAEWSYPLARLGNGNSLIIEPRVQAVISPNRNFTDDVFNEDSQFFQYDTVTLFDYSKGTGLDQWEDGQRLNVGISATAVVGNYLSVNSVVGTQFRAKTTNNFGDDIGLGEEASDIVGAVDFGLGRNIAIDNRFRVDDDTGSFRRVESTASGRLGPLRAGVTYLRIEADDFEVSQLRDEFLTIGGSVNITRNIFFAARQAQNLDSGDTTNTSFALRIANACSAISFNYSFDDSTRDGFEQEREFLVRIEVLGFQ
ncbi:MAG: LPS assembly protein LptD, partial [Pseudomonadota bacterium]